MKTSSWGQACNACGQVKQRCKGAKWVAESDGELRDFAEFRKDFRLFANAMLDDMGDLVRVVTGLTDVAQQLVAQQEERRSWEGSMVTAPYSELGDTELWQEFEAWKLEREEAVNGDGEDDGMDGVKGEGDVGDGGENDGVDVAGGEDGQSVGDGEAA